MQPSWFGSILSLILLVTQSSTIDSNTLAAMGVSGIGLMSVSFDLGGNFFGTGMISAVFQLLGSIPSLNELL